MKFYKKVVIFDIFGIIINLSEQYKFVDLKYYGIRQDWKEKL
ncbi:hypothetical protein [Criibacterium bergeronii]|nr:hypothetical protein [Criibacterium bergeronii]